MKDPAFLLVADDREMIQDLKQIVCQTGCRRVECCNSPTDAWAVLKAGKIDCVIASWEMAEMSGLALLKIVREEKGWYGLPFFIVDSAFTKGKIVQAGQAGVSGLIVHPFDAGAVKAKIQSLFEPGAEANFEEIENQIAEGLQLIDTQNYDQALNLFVNLIKKGEKAEYYYNIGYIKTAQEQYDEAVIAFRKATQLNHLFARAYEALGKVYKILGQAHLAEKALQKAADIHLSRDEHEYAEQILKQMIEINPNTINVYNSLGVLSRRRGDLPMALKYYKKALLVHPREPKILYNIGRLYLGMNRVAEAKAYFRKAIRLDPDFQEGHKALKALELKGCTDTSD